MKSTELLHPEQILSSKAVFPWLEEGYPNLPELTRDFKNGKIFRELPLIMELKNYE